MLRRHHVEPDLGVVARLRGLAPGVYEILWRLDKRERLTPNAYIGGVGHEVRDVDGTRLGAVLRIDSADEGRALRLTIKVSE